MFTGWRLAYGLCLCAISLCISCAAPKENPEKEVVFLVLKTLDNPFFVEIEKGVRSRLDSEKYSLVVRAGANEGDIQAQRDALETIATSARGDVAAVILTPSSSGGELVSEIRALNSMSVPLLLVDTKIDPEALSRGGAKIDFFVGSSNLEGGKIAQQVLTAAVPAPARLLVLNGVESHETANARRRGFLENLPDGYDLVERTANWSRDEARVVVDALLAVGEQIDGIFAANDQMALGAVEAYRQSPEEYQQPPIVGFDAIDEAVNAVENHELLATIAQDPFGMGVAAVGALEAVRAGEELDREIIVPVKPVVQRTARKP